MNLLRHVVRFAIAGLLVTAGVLHLLTPDVFLAQTPDFLPFRMTLVYVSGVIEILLGLGLLWPRTAPHAGRAAALFFLLIFPGNIWQAVAQVDAFGLDTDLRRIVRLFFQPILIIAALYGTHQRVPLPRRSNNPQR